MRVGLVVVVASLPALAAGGSGPKFAERLYPALQKANCRGCHTEDGVASATRLHFPASDASPADIEAFGRSLQPLVDPRNPEASLLVAKPTQRVKHTGGKLFGTGSPEEAALIEWAKFLATASPVSEAPAGRTPRPAATAMRRLTHSQYNRTVRDLLGDQTNPAASFPPEDFVNGFKNQADAQSIPALLAEAYGAAAEKLARAAFRGGDPNGLIPCKTRDARCRVEFVRQFGLKAFRRPLSAKEVERYAGLHASRKDFLDGCRLTVEAMLQSPNFLYRVERGATETRGYESASRLSYFLWDSMPDAALISAAAAGELGTREGIEKQARRLLADRKAREATDEFVSQWLRFDRLRNTVKDRRLFPLFSPEVALAMTEESRRMVADLVWNDRNFTTLFTAGYGFLNSDLAKLYGFPAPAGEFEKVSFPADSDRAGLTGHGAFLALTSKPEDTSPTSRGLFVREQFLCQHVPDPPPGTNATLPPVSESKPMTNRDRMEVHRANGSCASCHQLIDPIGFGLEKFDAVGQRREKLTLKFFPGRKEKERKPVTVELALDTAGSISGIPDSEFKSPKELGRVLAASPQCQECVVKQVFRYGYGRLETPADRAAIHAAFEKFRDSGFKFRELLAALAVEHAIVHPGETGNRSGKDVSSQ